MKVVTRADFEAVLTHLATHSFLDLDTETTGLRPHHGDKLFSIVIGTDLEQYYFNFNPGTLEETILGNCHTARMQEVLFANPSLEWTLFNAKFDMHMLAQSHCTLMGPIHDCRAVNRVVYNDYKKKDLNASVAPLGFTKDDRVEKYIDAHKLFTLAEVPTRQQARKDKHYDRVPFNLIVPYACQDVRVLRHLREHQLKVLESQRKPSGLDPWNVMENEKRLTKVAFNMERVGFKIDREYCERAIAFEQDRRIKKEEEFKRETFRDLMDSTNLFQEVFASEQAHWRKTKKGNPSFDGDALPLLKNPLAQVVLDWRGAQANEKFYRNFLYFADRDDIVHPQLNPDGADTGRWSSSDPNSQNLKKPEKGKELEFEVRRAVVPRPGFVFIMPDYDQIEYRLFLDYGAWIAGGETELVRKVKAGLDVHAATVQVTEPYRAITRDQAKTVNFLTVYGGGDDALAAALKVKKREAQEIQCAIFSASPELLRLMHAIEQTARVRGHVSNWAGRRYYFPNKYRVYTAPNKVMQGGAADVLKFAMVDIDEYLREGGLKSRMILCVHDELPMEIHESEVLTVPKRVKELMEEAYPYQYLPLTVGMDWSDKSLADKKEGFPA